MGDAHSQFAVDGHAKTSDAKMEFLWTCNSRNSSFVINKTDVVMCNIADAKMTHNYIS